MSSLAATPHTPGTGAPLAVVRDAVATVTDPEYPDISITDLGLVESIDIDGRAATVGLIPTFSGCPALAMIAVRCRGRRRGNPGHRSLHGRMAALSGVEHGTGFTGRQNQARSRLHRHPSPQGRHPALPSLRL